MKNRGVPDKVVTFRSLTPLPFEGRDRGLGRFGKRANHHATRSHSLTPLPVASRVTLSRR